ncbi:hypothetical protein AgCh_033732 [Apium graveolens]
MYRPIRIGKSSIRIKTVEIKQIKNKDYKNAKNSEIDEIETLGGEKEGRLETVKSKMSLVANTKQISIGPAGPLIFRNLQPPGQLILQESGAGSKLPLYLSELALGDYETKRDSISEYTLKQDEKHDFHSLNVLKTMKSVKAKGTTYLITFEACLHDYKNRNPQTFQTKIFMTHPYLPTLKIDIRFVRTKPN